MGESLDWMRLIWSEEALCPANPRPVSLSERGAVGIGTPVNEPAAEGLRAEAPKDELADPNAGTCGGGVAEG